MVVDECFDLIIREKASKYVWGVLLYIYIYIYTYTHINTYVKKS